jgi:non-homologous end joining protein Ku
VAAAPSEEAPAQIIDLMEALKASLARGGSRKTGAAEAEKKPARAAPVETREDRTARPARRVAGGKGR